VRRAAWVLQRVRGACVHGALHIARAPGMRAPPPGADGRAAGAQVESGAHAALLAALWADTAFLAGQGVMDYSLLVGVDRPNRTLVVGIIDFLRQARALPNPT